MKYVIIMETIDNEILYLGAQGWQSDKTKAQRFTREQAISISTVLGDLPTETWCNYAEFDSVETTGGLK